MPQTEKKTPPVEYIVCPGMTMSQVEAIAAPRGYRRAENGEDKKPGSFGEGFGGEPLIVLLKGDSGSWLLQADKDAEKSTANWKGAAHS